MALQEANVHVVSKLDISTHLAIPHSDENIHPLADDIIRVRTKFTSLTTNNLTYANLGTALAWWDTYPVPSTLPEPYSDRTAWDIVPVWGYAVVLESRIPGIPPGNHLFGFWPSSTSPVDLQLKPTEPAGHYIETSPHRKNVMTLYQRYYIHPSLTFSNPPPAHLTRETFLRTPFLVAHLLASYILPIHNPPIHPLGIALPWPPATYNPQTTTLVTLAAASTTARLTTAQILNPTNPDPLYQAYLAATTNPTALPFPTTTGPTAQKTSYATLPGTLASLAPPSRFLILDFGAPTPHVQILLQILATNSPNIPVTFLMIGTHPATAAALADAAIEEVVQMNASGAREAVIAQVGAEAYFADLERAWEEFVGREGEMEEWEVGVVEGV